MDTKKRIKQIVKADVGAQKNVGQSTEFQIRPNTPDSCPLLWEKADEPVQPKMRIMHGFTPKWFRSTMGVDYSRPWHIDPVLRHESLIKMKQTLNDHFPSLRLGGEAPESIGGTISVAYGTANFSSLFDVEVHWMDDNWPAGFPGEMTTEVAKKMKVPDFDTHPYAQELFAQMDQIAARWGKVEGVLNMQGILNNAFRIRGQEIFIDLIEDPALAHHIFSVVCDTLIAFTQRVYAKQAASGVEKEIFVTSNCVVNMIDGDMYEEFILPYDKKLAQAFKYFGIHNCAWNVDAYINGYSQIDKLGYLDFGIESDLERIAKTFPKARRCMMYSPVDLENKSLEEIRDDLQRVHDTLTPCEIIMTDIEDTCPDQRVVDFYEIAADIWSMPLEDLVTKTLSR